MACVTALRIRWRIRRRRPPPASPRSSCSGAPPSYGAAVDAQAQREMGEDLLEAREEAPAAAIGAPSPTRVRPRARPRRAREARRSRRAGPSAAATARRKAPSDRSREEDRAHCASVSASRRLFVDKFPARRTETPRIGLSGEAGQAGPPGRRWSRRCPSAPGRSRRRGAAERAFRLRRRSFSGTGDRGVEPDEADDNAGDIAVDRGGLRDEGDRGDRGGRIGADAGQRPQRCFVGRKCPPRAATLAQACRFRARE